ncbi:spore germination protein [Gorillibacterium sp. CAU 1737]|uniref:spore germination protein n=1 Tax=Gorillibacterium sp. CAU 1737 TaxID=3140362 RepID=UPI0032606A3E
MPEKDSPAPSPDEISAELAKNLAVIDERLGHSHDLVHRTIQYNGALPLMLLYMDGLVDHDRLHNSILTSLLGARFPQEQGGQDSNSWAFLNEQVLVAAKTGLFSSMDNLLHELVSGHAILLLEGHTQAMWVDASGWKERNVTEPSSQSVVRGPMEGFTENLSTNVSMIRKRIRDPRLWLENRQLGRVTKTNVSILYLSHLANPDLVNEVRRRLEQIDIDSVLESGYIEEEIQDQTLTPFPTIFNTERPDSVAAGILEGKVAILVDGTPFVLLVPTLFTQFFQSPEDYYQRADISSLLRIIRFLAFVISMLLPAMYIAITTYHQEMLPTNLLISLCAQREGVPFPAFIEALVMEITYEILREAGIRIPKTVGQAVSIVGTLVIGQAAVEAGIVSAAMVIVVSLTAISTYVIPQANMSIAVRMLRFVFMLLAASFGIVGILMGIIALTMHLASLRSFGVAYMSPLGPFIKEDLKDTIFRINWPRMSMRPVSNQVQNTRRQLFRKRRR